MKLLQPKTAKSKIKAQNEKEARKGVKIAQVIDKYTNELNMTKDQAEEAKEVLKEEHDAFVKKLFEERTELEGAIKSLKAEREELMKPIEQVREEADDLLADAKVKQVRLDEELRRKESELDEKEVDIAKAVSQNQNLQNELDSLKTNLDIREHNLKKKEGDYDGASVVLEARVKAHKSHTESEDERLKVRETNIDEREHSLGVKREALREERRSIAKDRIHLESQIQAFKAAQEEVKRKQ